MSLTPDYDSFCRRIWPQARTQIVYTRLASRSDSLFVNGSKLNRCAQTPLCWNR